MIKFFYTSELKHFPWQAANRNLTKGLSLRAGAPCDNFQGYCDVFLKCRQVIWTLDIVLYQNVTLKKVDAEGPLVRLKNLLLNQDTLLTIAQWVTVRPSLKNI